MNPEKGKLLISAPFLNDVFKRSVILLTEHNEEGSVGFIINKITDYKLHEIIEDFPEFDSPVYLGGPVQQDTLNFVHKAGDMLKGSFEIYEGLYWGGNYEELKYLIETNQIEPNDFKFFLGYAGWGPEQLAGELKTESWFLKNSDIGTVFSKDSEKLWSNVLKSMGKMYSIISTFPSDPSVN